MVYLLKIYFIFIPAEDILKRANAIWPSPDGNKLVYATFNDSEVQQVRWKVYEDTSEGNLDPYPKEKHMYYPKVSQNNSKLKWIYDVSIIICLTCRLVLCTILYGLFSGWD